MLYQDTTSGSLAWPDNPLGTLISPFLPSPLHVQSEAEPEPALLLGTLPWLIPLCEGEEKTLHSEFNNVWD